MSSSLSTASLLVLAVSWGTALLCQTTVTTAFLLAGSVKIVNRNKCRRYESRCNVVVGNDFAGYDDEKKWEEGQMLAQEFYREVQDRSCSSSVTSSIASCSSDDNSSKSPNSVVVKGTWEQQQQQQQPSKATPRTPNRRQRSQPSAGLFLGKQRMTVFSNTNSATSSSRGRVVPVPPTSHTYGSPTQLSISGLIAVILLSRYFWVQALISAGLIALYVIIVAAATSHGGGGGDWMGSNIETSVVDGAPVIEQTRGLPTKEDGL